MPAVRRFEVTRFAKKQEAPERRHSERAPSNEEIVVRGGSRSARDEQPSPAGSATAAFGEVGTKVPAANDTAEAARAEARLVGAAREALQHGDPGRALVVLEETQRRFPDGILLQEREALSISALAAVGRKAEAASRASVFLRAFPNSPHAERVRTAVRTHGASLRRKTSSRCLIAVQRGSPLPRSDCSYV
jgi:hypothetical protein